MVDVKLWKHFRVSETGKYKQSLRASVRGIKNVFQLSMPMKSHFEITYSDIIILVSYMKFKWKDIATARRKMIIFDDTTLIDPPSSEPPRTSA